MKMVPDIGSSTVSEVVKGCKFTVCRQLAPMLIEETISKEQVGMVLVFEVMAVRVLLLSLY